MEKLNWYKAIGYGALVWVIMFALVSFLIGYSWYDVMASKIIVVAVSGVLSYLFAVSAKPATLSQAFGYGVSWVIVGAALDLLITMQFISGAALFSAWDYWLSYALILFAPALYSGLSGSRGVKISHA